MSSSSTTACSRSPSPSPTTPEASDSLDPIVTQQDLSAWCNSLSSASFLMNSEMQFTDLGKRDEGLALELEDLLQDSAYDDSTPSGPDVCSVVNITSVSRSFPPSLEVTGLLSGHQSPVSMTKPVPPPPSQSRKDPPALQRVVYPLKELCYNLPIIFPSIPEGGTKSRVETQVRLTIDLAHASASSGEPFKYDKVGSWKWLRLPKGTATKKRTRKEGKVDAPPEDSLYLTADITCASPPHAHVTSCSSCQAREAKRVARKIAARVRPARSDSDSQDEVNTIPGRGRHEDTSNIIQFNCPEVLDFSAGSIILPLRITCYCRHHREKVGFNIHFTMLDHAGRVIGTGTTKPIMITDDHKSTGLNTPKSGILNGSAAGEASDVVETSKRKKNRGDNGAERTKKRSKPYDMNRSSRLARKHSSGSLASPSDLTSAFVTRSPSPWYAANPLQNTVSSPTLHFSHCEQTTSEILTSPNSQVVTSPLPSTEPPVPSADNVTTTLDPDVIMPDPGPSDMTTMSFEELATSPYLPAAPQSPSSLVFDPIHTLNNVANPPIPYILFKHDPPPPISHLPAPKIHRLIPSSGPTYGGIEVTVLGANFHPSMHLNCVFGSTPSTSTQRWSDNTLVCLLPPSTSSGVVQVWFDGMPKEEDGSPPSLFTYTDETDRALMELALQVVGLKMTGKIEDARNIAMRIVSTSSPNDTDPGMETSGAMQFASQANPSFDIRHLLLSRARDTEDFERLVLNFLSVLDVAVDTRAPSSLSSISHHTAGGQTLLHLAVLARFPALAKFLIMHGIDIDARDKNGCTALFFAATVGAAECAKLLVEAGAALDIVDGSGKTPIEVAAPGFFEFVDSDGSASEHASDREGEHEDEAAWGDVDDDTDDDADVTDKFKRRGERKATHWKLKTSHSVPEADSPAEPKSTDIPMESKKALEAGLVDEKQAVASFTETLYRTLAQLQHPQGMIANIPNLPMLQKRHLPGMPAWGALPQMPAVFPVIVPIPHLFTLFGERRAQDRQSGGDDKQDGTAQPWLGIGASDWRAVWEKWIAQVNTSMRANEATDNPPPAYTPRNADEAGDSPLVDVKEEMPLAAEPSTHVGVDRAIARPVVYEAQPIPEDEVNSYEYRPARKLARKTQKKHDRMLVLFWIPILFIGIAWAFLHAIRIAFHATKTVVTLKAGLRV